MAAVAAAAPSLVVAAAGVTIAVGSTLDDVSIMETCGGNRTELNCGLTEISENKKKRQLSLMTAK